MTETENIFVRFLKWIGLIKKTPVDKSEMCRSAQGVCNRECNECIWSMYDCADREEKVRPYDPIWDMYLDEFEDDKDVSTSAERKEE